MHHKLLKIIQRSRRYMIFVVCPQIFFCNSPGHSSVNYPPQFWIKTWERKCLWYMQFGLRAENFHPAWSPTAYITYATLLETGRIQWKGKWHVFASWDGALGTTLKAFVQWMWVKPYLTYDVWSVKLKPLLPVPMLLCAHTCSKFLSHGAGGVWCHFQSPVPFSHSILSESRFTISFPRTCRFIVFLALTKSSFLFSKVFRVFACTIRQTPMTIVCRSPYKLQNVS